MNRRVLELRREQQRPLAERLAAELRASGSRSPGEFLLESLSVSERKSGVPQTQNPPSRADAGAVRLGDGNELRSSVGRRPGVTVFVAPSSVGSEVG